MKKLLFYIGLVFLLSINNVVADILLEEELETYKALDRVLLDAPISDPKYIERLTLEELWKVWQRACKTGDLAKKHALIKPIIAKVQSIDQYIIQKAEDDPYQDIATDGTDSEFHTNKLSNYGALKRDILFAVLEHLLNLDHKYRPDHDSAEETLAELATDYVAIDNKRDETELLKRIQLIFIKMQAIQEAIIDETPYKKEYDRYGIAQATGAKNYSAIKTAILLPLVQDAWSLLNIKQLITVIKNIDSKEKLEKWVGSAVKVISHHDNTITAIIFVGGRCNGDKELGTIYKDLCHHLYKLAIDIDSADHAKRAELLCEIEDYYTKMSAPNADVKTIIEQFKKILSDADINNKKYITEGSKTTQQETKDYSTIRKATMYTTAAVVSIITAGILYFEYGRHNQNGLVILLLYLP